MDGKQPDGMSYDSLVSQLELSLESAHDALRLDSNPVISQLTQGELNEPELVWVLQQYSFFPLTIVEILAAIASRVNRWPRVHEELLENIGQECGALTQGRAHYLILRDCIYKQFHLDIAQCEAARPTTMFLERILNTVRTVPSSPAFASGVAYALEDSALPELKIVAEIANGLWKSQGNAERLISRHTSKDREYAEGILAKTAPSDYSLEDFFAVHLLSIEVDHRVGLRNAVRDYLHGERAAASFQEGFELTLNAMDKWWDDLATEAKRVRNPAADGIGARENTNIALGNGRR